MELWLGCKYRQTWIFQGSEYAMDYVPGFQICQGSWYTEKKLVLEQATLIFEMELF